MKTTKSVVLCAMIIVQAVKGQNNKHKVYLEGGLANGTQNTSFVSGVYGGLGFFLNQHSSIDIKARRFIISRPWILLALLLLITVIILIAAFSWAAVLLTTTRSDTILIWNIPANLQWGAHKESFTVAVLM